MNNHGCCDNTLCFGTRADTCTCRLHGYRHTTCCCSFGGEANGSCCNDGHVHGHGAHCEVHGCLGTNTFR
jgi:hypothetical protein